MRFKRNRKKKVVQTKNNHQLPRTTILHTADFHFPGQRAANDPYDTDPQKSPFRTLEALVDTANRLEVDLVLLAGDLFNTHRPSDEVVSFAIDQFQRLNAPTVLIPGNHDCVGQSEVYTLPVWQQTGNKPHVITSETGETFEVPGLPIVLWAKAMSDYNPEFQPLKDLPKREKNAWHIAMGHGLLLDDGDPTWHNFPVPARQIRESGWDYIALGHHHGYKDVSRGSVKAAYSGSPVAIWNEDPVTILVTLSSAQDETITIKKQPLFME